MQELTLQQGKALVVVAHPDDETIWMGGTMLRYSHIKWTIFVLSRQSDPDRMPKFQKVAAFYKARGIICDLEDEGIMTIEQSIPKIKRLIRNELKPKKFDYIFTHAYNGEYGHSRHKGVHRAVTQMIKAKELIAPNHFYFAYILNTKKGIAQPQKRSDFFVTLSTREFQKKRTIIKKLYGFGQSSFENRSCAKIEKFNSFKS